MRPYIFGIVWMFYALHYSLAYQKWYEGGAVWAFLSIVAIPLIIFGAYKAIRHAMYSNRITRRWCITAKWFLQNNVNIKGLFRWILLSDIIFAGLTISLLYIYDETYLTITKYISYLAFYLLPLFNALPYLLEYWFYRRRKVLFLLGLLVALNPLLFSHDLPYAGKYVLYPLHLSVYGLMFLFCLNIARYIRYRLSKIKRQKFRG